MTFQTADLCDALDSDASVVAPLFRDFGGQGRFRGVISTVKCYEDNSYVRAALETPGEGKVLVVDGGGSMRCALLGDMLAELGVRNGWSGVIVFGCIRDSETIGRTPLGVKALATHPRKSVKKGAGERDVPVHFADTTFNPGEYLYADADGIVVTPGPVG